MRLPTLTTVLERFPEVRWLILVSDRGLLSLNNLEALEAVRLANGTPLEFILAVPGRRYHEFAELLVLATGGPSFLPREITSMEGVFARILHNADDLEVSATATPLVVADRSGSCRPGGKMSGASSARAALAVPIRSGPHPTAYLSFGL